MILIKPDGSVEIITRVSPKPITESRRVSRQQRGSQDSQFSVASHRGSRNGEDLEKGDFGRHSQMGDNEVRQIELESQRQVLYQVIFKPCCRALRITGGGCLNVKEKLTLRFSRVQFSQMQFSQQHLQIF